MKKLLLLTLLLTSLGHADDIIKPGAKDPSQARYMYLKDATGATVPAVVIYTTDGSGNIIPLSSPGLAATVNQGNAGSSFQSWWVQAAALPLPTNAAQETGGNLAGLNAKFSSLGQKTMAASAPMVIASDQSPIPVSGTITATNPSVGTNGSAAPSSSTQVGVKDNSGNLQPLTLTAGGAVKTDSSATTQPVSVSSLPLPSNAAIETGGHLASIDTKLGAGVVAQDSTVANVQGSVAGGVAGSKSSLAGVQYNSVLPSLSNGQQAALQADSSGRIIVGSIAAALPAGSNALGSVSVSNFPGTQPISGTVTANAGTGTFTVGQATGSNLHTAVDSLPAIPAGANTIGAVNQAGAPWSVSGSGSFTVAQATGTNLHAVIDSGAITANIGTTNGLALDTSVAAVQGSVSGGTVATRSSLDGGQYNSATPTLTNGQQAALQLDSSGELKIAPIPAGANTIGAVNQAGSPWGVNLSAAIPAGGNTIGAVNQAGAPWSMSDLADGSVAGGTAGSKSILAGIQYNSSLPALTTGQQAAAQSDSSGRLLVGSIASALPAGSNSIGSVTANAGTGNFTVVQGTGSNLHTAVDSLPSIPVGANVIGAVTQSGGPWTTSDSADGSVTGGSAGSKSMLGGAQYNASPITLTTGQQAALQSDVQGKLLIGALASGANAIGSVAINSALPAGANSIGSVTANIGTTNGLALDNTIKNVQGSAGAGVAATSSNLTGGVFNTSPPSLTNGQQVAMQVTSAGKLIVDPSSVTSPVSVASLPLPSNAAIETGGHLASLDTKTPSQGQAAMAASVPVAIASNQSAIPVSQNGTWNITNVSGTVSLPTNAAQETGGNLATISTNTGNPLGSVAPGTAAAKSNLGGTVYNTAAPTPTNGQQLALQSDSSGRLIVNGSNVTQPISASALPLPSNAAQETGGNLATIATNTSNTNTNLQNPQGSVTGGTAGSKSQLMGGVFNTSLPSLTTGQQVALQLDSSGRQIIAPLTNTSVVKAQLEDNAGTALTSQSVNSIVRFNTVNPSEGASASATPFYSTAVGGNDGTNLRTLATDTSGNLKAIGNSASGAADSGNPVKVGTVFNTTVPTPTNGNREDMQSNMFGAVSVAGRWTYRNITGNATTTIKSGAGTLHAFCMNNQPTGGTATVFDNTAGSGTVIATLTNVTGNSAFCSGPLDAEFTTGLTVTTAGAGTNNLTFYYQ